MVQQVPAQGIWEPGLMRRITYQRAGSTVDEPTCALFVAIERVTCTVEVFDARVRGSAIAVARPPGTAPPSLPPPPPAVGDVIMGPLGASTGAVDASGAEESGAPSVPDLFVWLPPVTLPPDFTQQIRSLPANTLLHVFSSCRLRMIAAVAQCWQGMARGSDEYSLLDEGRSKLLLSPVLPSLGAATEVTKRLTLWEEVPLADLVQWAEERLLLNRWPGKKAQRSCLDNAPARADLARRTPLLALVARPPTGLVSSMLSFEESEDLSWAKELFPTSSLGAQACSDPLLELPSPSRGGLALRRVHDNKIRAVLSASFAESQPVRSHRPLAGSRARGSAGARRTANRDPSRWANSCARPTPSSS